MKMVSAMCPNCGAKLELDENMEKGFCMYCGTQVIVDDAVRKYKLEVSGKVSVEGILTADDLVKNGEMYLDMKNYPKAQEYFAALNEKYPRDWRGWWGLIRTVTKEFTVLPTEQTYRLEPWTDIETYFDYVKKLAPEQEMTGILSRFEPWYDKFRKAVRGYALNDEYAACENDYDRAKSDKSYARGTRLKTIVEIVFVPIIAIILVAWIIVCLSILFGDSWDDDTLGLVVMIIFIALPVWLLIWVIKKFFTEVLPEYKGAVRDIQDAKELRQRSKERMAEIDRERNDMSRRK